MSATEKDLEVVGTAARKLRSIGDAIRAAVSPAELAKASSPSTQMAIALNSKRTYEGTVAKAVVARRRAKNKRARIARRAAR